MNTTKQLSAVIGAGCLAVGTMLPTHAIAQYAPSGSAVSPWQFEATIYGYLPSVGGKLAAPVDAGGTDLNVNAHQIISNLKMAFMGTLDVHYDRWGVFTDVLYLNVSGNKSKTHDFSIDDIGLPAETTADINLDLKGTIWTIAGEYRLFSDPQMKLDLLAGARQFGIKPTLGWSIYGDLGPIPESGRSGSRQINETVWDGIVGVKGRYAFGDDHRWYVPYYVDVGTGQSQLTWQIAGGVGYAYNWGSIFAMWRYLDYNFKSGKQLQDINFNGPMLGVAFSW